MPIRSVVRHKVSVESEVAALQCNVCGVEEGLREHGELPYDMHVIRLGGGWGDDFPGDLETITFVVHGKCLKAWAETFAVPVESRHAVGSVPPISCTHSETWKAVVLQWGWLRDADQPYVDPEIEDTYSLPHSDLIPAPGIYEHFKGGLYQVFDHGWDSIAPHEAYVVYQALYGESKIWARPARMWAMTVSQEGYWGPRFQIKYEVEGAPIENKFRTPE